MSSLPEIVVSPTPGALEYPAFTVEIPPANLIYAEILAVTSAMRKNQRWAASSFSYYPSGSNNNLSNSIGSRNRGGNAPKAGSNAGLMSGFMALKMELRETKDVSKLDALVLLHPFLEVVRSPETSGPITATALASIDKFLSYSLLHADSPNLVPAMAQLSTASTHCKFEASDSVSDEVVLLKILDILRNCLTGKLGAFLSDESVCEMMETGLSMCCQMRLSEMLRRSAERTMHAMVAAIFSKLRTFSVEHQRPTLAGTSSTLSFADSLAENLETEGSSDTGMGVRMTAPDPRSGAIPAAKIVEEEPKVAETERVVKDEDAEEDSSVEEVKAEEALVFKPYGLASLKELLRVLISLLNPQDQQHTDSMRLTSLGLLTVAFEVGGRSIGRFPALRPMVADHLCKHLFQLARSDNITLLSSSFRVISNVFDTMKPHLKLQYELFVSFLLDRLVVPLPSTAAGTRKSEVESQLDQATWAADPSAEEMIGTPNSGPNNTREKEAREGSAEARELMLEILCHVARGSYGVVDLWVNYDCNIEGEDLFERLIKFLCRGAFPPNGNSNQIMQEASQLLSLDTVLSLVGHMSSRLDQDPAFRSSKGLTAAEAAAAKAHKRILLEGAAAFNLKPKVGLKFLEEHGIIYADPLVPRPESLARFFKTTPRLDKKLLGDFISRPDQLDVLKAFMRLMEFDGKIICDAMRELLEAFRLPGESQQIARITETFAEVYFATGPPDINSQDATYVLAYSVIMLNTDLHNPQVRKRMDITAYSRNLRGVNENADFTPEYLLSIYESIRKREIVLPEEHQNQVGFEYGWKELLRRTRQAGPFIVNSSNEFDAGMFAVSWRPIVSALSFGFANFNDDYMVQRVIAGFNQCAALAARYDIPEVFDYLILSLSRVAGLTQISTSAELGNFPVVDIEGQKVTVSPLAIRFGSNVRAQLAAVVLFTIANNNGASIREGWRHIFEIYQTLFVHSLLPPSLLSMEDFLSGESVIPLKPTPVPAPREDRRTDGGLLSTLSSYLLSPYGSSGEVSTNDFSDDDIETTLSAMDCIVACKIEELYSQITELKGEALIAPVQVLVDLTQKMTVEKLRARPVINNLGSPQLGAATNSRTQLPYNPSAVLLLEILTSIVAKAPDSLVDLWPLAFDFLSKVLASANSFSSLFNERAVASLLRLATIVIKEDGLRDSTFLALDNLRSLSPTILDSVAEPLMTSLADLIVENVDRIHSTVEWGLVFALFSATIQQEEAAKVSFDIMRRLASGQLGTGLQAENYTPFLQVLSGYASVPAATVKAAEQPSASDEPMMQRGRHIVDILRDTQAGIPRLIDASVLSPPRAWEAAWIPLLSVYAQLCLNPSRELRQVAIGSLQRTLLAPEILANSDVDLSIIFERVFFPMLEELLKPQVFRRDPAGMSETRLRASALLCKIFLQYLTQLTTRQGMSHLMDLWLKILGYQDRFMHSGRRDQMYEAVPESLKNVLLVMNASGFLLPPYEERSEEQVALWDATFERIQPFLPDLKDDLFPPPQLPVPFSSPSPVLEVGGAGGASEEMAVTEVAVPVSPVVGEA